VILGVGDLVGHGSPAVAGMVMIKNMMRGQAVEGRRSLSAGIERLDQALAERGLLATLFYAVWDPIHSTLTWVSAGHVPVILRHPDGGVTMLEGGPSDSLIGLGDNVRRSTTETPVGPGTTLILYTDGLVEAPGVDIGEAIDELSRLQPEPGDRLIDAILAHRKDERDDVAILVAHW
jgi:serine phosphatase RsbU (regulator of sigma subunit)